MTFWQFLDSRWPSERAWVTVLLAFLIGALLSMAKQNPGLWDVELFKTLLTATVVTGALNMVLPFHYSANKTDEKKAEIDEKRADNTGKAFEAITATANKQGDSQKADIELDPGESATIAAPEEEESP